MSHNPFDQRFPTDPADHRVVILGASHKPVRYAHQAQRLLMTHGYQVVPVHPKLAEVEGVKVVPDLAMVNAPVHTLTMYIGPERSAPLHKAILALTPTRAIFNPGTESPELEEALRRQGCEVIQGCTLVMLKTKQF